MGKNLSTVYPQLIPKDTHRKPQNFAIYGSIHLDHDRGLGDYITASDGLRTETCEAEREVGIGLGEGRSSDRNTQGKSPTDQTASEASGVPARVHS